MNFGVPSQRVKKEEAFPSNAILTVGIDGGKGTSRTMSFNKIASEMLGLGDKSKVAFSFDPAGEVFIVNTDTVIAAAPNGIRVTKGIPRKVSCKKTYNYLVKSHHLDTDVENHYELIASDDYDGAFCVLPFVASTGLVDIDFDRAVIQAKIDAASDAVNDEVTPVTTFGK